MIGILEFCLSRGLTHLTMLAESRLAERIAAYGWPLRYLGAPREYEGGKGVAVAAEITVGQHVLALTRAKTGIVGNVLFEIDPDLAANGSAAQPIQASNELRDLVADIGFDRLRRLTRALSEGIAGAEDRAGAIELLGAMNRLVEAAGLSLEGEPSSPTAGASLQPAGNARPALVS